MKILLVNPPRFNEIIGNNPSIIEEKRGYNPLLGLLYISSYIKEHTNHEISIIDSQVERLDYHSLKSKTILEKPDVVCITAMTMLLIDVNKTTRIKKEVDNRLKQLSLSR